MVVHSILHPSREEISLPYMVGIRAWIYEVDPVVDGLTRKLGNEATIRDVAEVVVEAVEGDIVGGVVWWVG